MALKYHLCSPLAKNLPVNSDVDMKGPLKAIDASLIVS